MSADRRRQEIEEKKAKLAELKRAREERLRNAGSGSEAGGGRSGAQTPLRNTRPDVDDLVSSLLGPSHQNANHIPSVPSSSATPSISGIPRRPSSIAGAHEYARPRTPAFPRSEGMGMGTVGGVGATSGGSGMGGMSESRPMTPRPESRMSGRGDLRGQGSVVEEPIYAADSEPLQQDLVDQQEELYEIPTKPVYITYSRGIQTTYASSSSSERSSSPPPSETGEDDHEADPKKSHRRSRKHSKNVPDALEAGSETIEQMKARMEAEWEAEKERLEKEIREEEALKRKEEMSVLEITEDDRKALTAAPDFTKFMEESTKIVQRALKDTHDYTKDYSSGVDGDVDPADASAVKLTCVFGGHDRWTENRSITAVDWSPKFPELLAASYNQNPKAPADPHGIIAIWNLHLVDRPEFVFHSQSDVLSIAFSPYHPNLIFGGCYSGQISLWDTRAKSLPVLKTPLSSAGHTYPIYAMRIVGTQNANQLVTASTDGTVCSWTADMLARPQEMLELTSTGHSRTNEVSVTCMDFPDNESSSFWIGTEEGGVFQANRYARAGSKAGLNQKDLYRGHSGPVTSLNFHPLRGPVDFSDLFLTTGVDWTVKLWRARTSNKSGSAATSTGQGPASLSPLRSFEESADYVYDAKWHPQHPAIFATGDASGKFDLWNLNTDVEMPATSVSVGTTGRALNKLAWDRQLGRKIALGSGDGTLNVYDIGDQAVPRESEWSEMQKTVQAMMASSTSGVAQTV